MNSPNSGAFPGPSKAQAILAASGGNIFSIDRDGVFTYVTPSMAKALDRTPDDMVGRTWEQLGLDPGAMDQIEKCRDDVLSSGQTIRSEVWSPTAKSYYEFEASPLAEDDRDIGAVVFTMFDVTHLKRAEEGLRRSEATYRGLFDDNTAVMLLIDPSDGQIVDANKAAIIYYGYDRDELTRMRIGDINTLPQDEVKREMDRSVGGIKRRFIFRHRLASGEVRDVVVYSGPVNTGERSLLYSIVHDITESRKAERALEESEAKYRNLFDSTNEAMALHELVRDQDGVARDYRYIDVNPAWERMFDKRREEVIGHTAKQVFGDIEDYWIRTFAKVVETGQAVMMENYAAALNRHYSVNAWKFGDRTCAVGIVDVTDRRRMELELEETKARLEAIIEQMPVGIMVADARTGRILFANDHIERIYGLGFKPTEIKGFADYPRFARRHLDGQPYRTEEYPFVRSLRGEVIINELAEMMRPDGSEVFISSSGAPVYDHQGNIVASVALSIDVTEQMKVQMERDRLLAKMGEYSRMLQRSNAELQQFAYIASHDLREPLRTISTHLMLFERRNQGKLDENSRQSLDFAIDASNRLKEMIDDLLAYSRVDTKGEELTPTDMNSVVKDVLMNLSMRIRESGAEVIVEHLPTVLADPSQMVQLLQNLIGNALKFQTKGSVPEVRISAIRTDREWQFSVKDNGIGMTEKDMKRLFHMFQRLHTRDEYEGTGIGLAIVRKIVERHGGRVWVESEPGKGSTFLFTIPA
jgi:PAS domain S-box-containing protein